MPSPAFVAQATLTSPALIPILQAYPAGTSPTSNPSVWQYDAPGRQIDNEDSGMVRLDHYFSDRTTAFVRFNADEAVESIPTGQLTAKTLYDTKFNNGVVALSHVFTPSLINEVKFGVNQTIYHTANLSPVPFGVAVSGFSSLTGSSTTDYPSKTFDLIDDVSWAKGKHILKFGFETRWILLNQGTSQSGTLTYTSTAAFLDNTMGSASYTAILPAGAAAQDSVLRLRAGRMESDCQSDDHGRNPLQLFQCPACDRQRRRSVRFRHVRRLLPAHRFLLSSPLQRFRPASRHRLGAWRHRSARGRRHLPHRRPGRRSEPSDLEYRGSLLLQQHGVPHAFLSLDSVSSIRGSGRTGRRFSARSGSQPERRLRGGLDRVGSAQTALGISSEPPAISETKERTF